MTPIKSSLISRIIFSKASFTIIGILVITLISLPLIKNIKKQISVNDEVAGLDSEIMALNKKNSELKDLISYLNSDQFVEEQARLNLNYRKVGEEVMVIKDKNNEAEVSANLADESPLSLYNIKGLGNKPEVNEASNVHKWIKYFWN